MFLEENLAFFEIDFSLESDYSFEYDLLVKFSFPIYLEDGNFKIFEDKFAIIFLSNESVHVFCGKLSVFGKRSFS
jgi:hypothetical protein